MATNYLPQSNPQPWSWEADMDSHHHFQQEEDEAGEREHMFEKPLTPSDVGKLNRLVIPKQHAERHFPVAGESGLLLSFHDESGKEWRFRYSYWTSSQSYVLTKGWSRFVKEKRLDAGDVVLFQRRRRDHLLYIGSRRRGELRAPPGWGPGCYAAAAEVGTPSGFYINPMLQRQDFNLQGNQSETTSVTTGISPGNPKRLRLFGVNLDCGPGV